MGEKQARNVKRAPFNATLFLNLHENRANTEKNIMNRQCFLYLLAYYLQISATTTQPPHPEMEYTEGAHIDPKYSLPRVNFSDSDGNHTLVPANLARVLNFYNTELLAANWGRTQDYVTSRCRKDVQSYLEGLKKTEKWALKSK